MKKEALLTKEKNTWCSGCTNFAVLRAVKEAISELRLAKNTSIVTGIGCHAKIYDYLNLRAFYGLHGRVLPIAFGVKLGNPDLNVIGFGGDGDTYAEGMEHFVHNCRYNADLTMLVHNNQVFSLTTGQFTPTTEKGFKGASSPLGVNEIPLNPLVLALAAGATFVARGYALETSHLKELIKQAISHKGFAFIDILQPCIMYHKHSIPFLNRNVYKISQSHKKEHFGQAMEKAREWDYSYEKDSKVPIGVFYQSDRSSFQTQWTQLKRPWHEIDRKINLSNIVGEFK